MENLQNYTTKQIVTSAVKAEEKIKVYPEPLKELLLYSTTEEWNEIFNSILDRLIPSITPEQSNELQDLMYSIRLLQHFFKRIRL